MKTSSTVNNVLVLDVETTISNKGNPFDLTNKLVCVGLLSEKWSKLSAPIIYYEPEKYIEDIQDIINKADLIVGFNIKFDLHWLRRIGIDIGKIKVWDCQVAEFIIDSQQNKYPSLDGTAEKYGLGKKLDVVKTEYWDKEIDTDAIPRDILSEYLAMDLELTEQVYLKQVEQYKVNGRSQLLKLHCQDLLVLEEIEWNGIKFNTEKAREHAGRIEMELKDIYAELTQYTNGCGLNLNSNDHLSCLLYGGVISIPDKLPIGVFKSGEKKGQVKYKNITKDFTFPRLVEPAKGTEVKKPEGSQEYWQVNETVLRKLKLTKEAKKIVGLLNQYGVLEKLRGTYLNGYSDLIDTMNWEKGMIHGVLNQCVAVTGRLSSSKPNLQNVDPATKIYMESRYI